MWIDLDRARKEPFHWQETREVPAATLEREELAHLGEIDWGGRVQFTDPGFYLTGHLAYEQGLVCTRCLKTFTEPVEADVELLLLVEETPYGAGRHSRGDAGENSDGSELELQEEDLGVLTLTEERFNTDPVLFEQLQLNVPMKPVCRPDCQGLCPQCGKDRNEGDCDCVQESVDPRWQGLSGLKERLAEQDRD